MPPKFRTRLLLLVPSSDLLENHFLESCKILLLHWYRRKHSICGETYSCHEGSILSCLILTQESCQQWLPSKTIGTKRKKKFASPLLSRHCCINFLYSDDLILHRHDAPFLMMHLFLCVCRQLFAKIQTASNISCFVSHIQIKKLLRISYMPLSWCN